MARKNLNVRLILIIGVLVYTIVACLIILLNQEINVDAKVTFTGIFKNVCNPEDLDGDFSFKDMVKYLVEEEGIYGCVDELHLIKIEQIGDENG